jgi:hypothetical protein
MINFNSNADVQNIFKGMASKNDSCISIDNSGIKNEDCRYISVERTLLDIKDQFDNIHSINSAIASSSITPGVNGHEIRKQKIKDLIDCIHLLKEKVASHFDNHLDDKKSEEIARNRKIFEVNNMFKQSVEVNKLFKRMMMNK